MLRTPLYLAEFLQTYAPKEPLPETTGTLTKRFLRKKYDRENSIDLNFDGDSFESLMKEYSAGLDGANPQIPEQEVKTKLKKLVEKSPFTPETLLQKAVNMNVMIRHLGAGGQFHYSFAHQSYQDYYEAEYWN